MDKVDILVFGSAIVDFICYVDRLPKPGETLHGSKFLTGFGGKGANQCVAAAKLGAKTAMIAKLGDDFWGNDYLHNLEKQGVNVEHVQRCKNQTTGIAQISVASQGENHIIIVAGANNSLSQDDVVQAECTFQAAKFLICQLEVPVEATLSALRSFKGTSILNAAPAMADVPSDLLKAASILCVNESEATLMTGSNDITSIHEAKEALLKLVDMGANTVIITLGRLGAVYTQNNKCYHIPAKKIEHVVDTTGAGDAFIGALAYFMSNFE